MAKTNKTASSSPKETLIEELSGDFDTFESWLIENWKLVAAIGAVIILGVAAFSISAYVIRSRDAAAVRTFSDAKTAEALLAAIAAYPNHAGAVNARTRLAGIYIADKNYDKALAEFRSIASSDADPFLRSRASVDCAYVLEVQGKNEEAIHEFEALSANPQIPEELRAESAYAAGRLYLAKNDLQKARALLSRVIPGKNVSPVYQTWAEKSAAILNRLPAEEGTLSSSPVLVPASASKPASSAAPEGAASGAVPGGGAAAASPGSK